MNTTGTPEEYLVARIREALATDGRTNVLDVQVETSEESIVIRGIVNCSARRDAAEAVIAELLPYHKNLVNLLCVQTFQEPSEAEQLG
jgi:hypothetical protein